MRGVSSFLWLLGLAFLATAPARAAAPNGLLELVISGPAQIFLPAGPVHWSVPGHTRAGDVRLTADYDFVVGFSGQILGLGTLDLSGVATAQDMPIAVVGKLTGNGVSPKAKIVGAFAGDIDVFGFPGTGLGVAKLSCAHFDAIGPGELGCGGRVRFCGTAAPGAACGTQSLGLRLPLVGGDWTLALDLATDTGGRVSGTARVTLGNGAMLDLAVAGKYNPKTDTSSLKLVAPDPAAKVRVVLTRFSADGSSGTLKFKVAGQTGTADLSSLP